MADKKPRIVRVKCPKSGNVHTFDEVLFQGKNMLRFSCSDCGETHQAYLEDEDFSQTAARIVREATED